MELKKRVLRTVLEEIVIDSHDDPPHHELYLHWKGGVHTELRVPRNLRAQHGHRTDDTAIDLIRELSKVCDDRAIAAVLNRLSLRTGCGKSWQAMRESQARYTHKLPNFKKNTQWLTMQNAADELKVSATVIQRLIKETLLPARQVVKYAPWIIERKDIEQPMVLAAVDAVHRGIRRPSTVSGQQELALEQHTNTV